MFDAIYYFLAIEPPEPLSLKFIDGTPNVSEYKLLANFRANRCGVNMVCSIPRLGKDKTDCKNQNTYLV